MIPDLLSAALESGHLDKTLAATLVHFDCQAGTIHLLREGQLQLAAHAGIPDAVVRIVETVPIGKGIAGLAAERRAPITICNLQTDESGQARPGARATGMEGSIAVPMLGESRELRGVLGIAKSGSYDWSEKETAALQDIANRLALRISA